MKKFKKILFSILCLTPMIIFASEGDEFPATMALFMEAFISIHMSIFVLLPLSKMLSKPENSTRNFWILFFIRVVVLLFFDFFVTPLIAVVDFLAVFIGAFIIVPIVAKMKGTSPIGTKISPGVKKADILIKPDGTQTQSASVEGQQTVTKEPIVYPSHFSNIYSMDDNSCLESFLKIELSKIGLEESSKLIPMDILKRKKVFNIIFSILLTAFTSLLFFHFDTAIYVGGIIILFGFFILTRRYNLMKFIMKEVKSRPQEKITNIIMNIKTGLTEDTSRGNLFIGFIAAIIIPVVLFMNPRIMYEELDNGYSVRFYIQGIIQPKDITIPDTYKGKPVISVRGNVFSNLNRVESITLPDTITEIRGQAFQNSKSLNKVKLPSNLVILGGSAFKNCTSLESIELPDTLIELGGESFLNASSLRTVKLSNQLTEIRGNTFENCTSLESIVIPDSVTRIGGSAFRQCTSLSEVILTPYSKLEEIGSSAFRVCHSLYEIKLPRGTYINERSFKESPTVITYFDDHLQ